MWQATVSCSHIVYSLQRLASEHIPVITVYPAKTAAAPTGTDGTIITASKCGEIGAPYVLFAA
jgi:hypothetical protein